MLDSQTPPPKPTPPAILRFFAYQDEPPLLHPVLKPFHDLAHALFATTDPSAEQSAGLRKLLEARDCFRRAALDR